jgi:ATP-dependent DNA ligase
MAKETIILAKTFKAYDKLTYPLQATEKLDGVPVNIFIDKSGKIRALSRQGEDMLSSDHILEYLKPVLSDDAHVVGELYVQGMDFKDISGLARRKDSTEETAVLNLYIWDFYFEGDEELEYVHRMWNADEWLAKTLEIPGCPIKWIRGAYVEDAEQLETLVEKFRKDHPHSEGLVFRALRGPKAIWRAGWRSPGVVKLKWTETLDLPIDSLEEAVSKDGEPLGMVGRINVRYKGKVSGVGPGKLSHKDRIALWNDRHDQPGKMIEVGYMPDDSYEGLREGRYYRHRPDKD